VKGQRADTAAIPLTGLAIAPQSSPQLVKQPLLIVGATNEPAFLKGSIAFKVETADVGTRFHLFRYLLLRCSSCVLDSAVDFSVELSPSLFIAPAQPAPDASTFFNLLRTKATETKTGRLPGPLAKAVRSICGTSPSL